MEIALPLIALGSMYVISNQSSSSSSQQERIRPTENFTNMGKPTNYLPNTNIAPQNFPVMNMNQLSDTVQEYPNPNKYKDSNSDDH